MVYGMQGVCCIDDIAHLEIASQQGLYYVLTPVFVRTSSIYVPVENEQLVLRMHPVMQQDEAQNLVDCVPALDTIWIPDPLERKETYKRILLAGNRKELTSLIKTLYLHRLQQRAKGKKLHLADERCLKDAQRILFTEMAQVLQISIEEVGELLTKKII